MVRIPKLKVTHFKERPGKSFYGTRHELFSAKVITSQKVRMKLLKLCWQVISPNVLEYMSKLVG
jgi:hypothetical protein